MKLENFTKYNAQTISIASSSLIGWGLGATINSESLLFSATGAVITGMLGSVVEINILPNLKTVWGTLAIGAVMSAFYPLNAPYLNGMLIENELQIIAPNYNKLNTKILAFEIIDTSSLESKILSKSMELNQLKMKNKVKLTQIHSHARRTLVENKYDSENKIKKTYTKWWHKLKNETGCKITNEESIILCLENQAKNKIESLQDVVTKKNELDILKQNLESKKAKNLEIDTLVNERDSYLSRAKAEVVSIEVLGLILFLFGFFIEGGIFSILKGIQIREEREIREIEEEKKLREERLQLQKEAIEIQEKERSKRLLEIEKEKVIIKAEKESKRLLELEREKIAIEAEKESERLLKLEEKAIMIREEKESERLLELEEKAIMIREEKESERLLELEREKAIIEAKIESERLFKLEEKAIIIREKEKSERLLKMERERMFIGAEEKKKEQASFWLKLAYDNPTKKDPLSNNIVATLVLAKDQQKDWDEISNYAIWKFNKEGYTTKCETVFHPLGSTSRNKNREGITPQQKAILTLKEHGVSAHNFSFEDLKHILDF